MQRLGRNYQSIQEQGSAVQRAGASEREGENERHADTWTGPEQHTSGTRALLAFVVWLWCRSDCPSTRARRMRHSVEDKGNTASVAVCGGREQLSRFEER
jgi:hypothetical protein